MGYRALLFCPDEKIARTVTQVLSELEFDVESCIEPFAAVKKLMAEHFDAVVVDCDNDQNATLLFKSARNSAINQTSLAVAVVEGQAGVAKAFRIGANLVLTKPINVEQAKGTLRVARGLLRKGEAAKPSVPASVPMPAPAMPPRAVSPAPTTPARPATLAAASAAKAREAAALISKPAPAAPAKSEDQPVLPAAANAISTPSLEAVTESGGRGPASKSAHPADTANIADTAVVPPTRKAAHFDIGTPASSSGAASAPAPAREAAAPVVETTAQSPTRSAAASGPMAEANVTYSNPADPKTHESAAAPAPAFTFGGANLPEKSESGGNKKVFLAIAAAALLAAALYFGWTQMQGKSSTPAATSNPPLPAQTKVPASTQPAQVQSPAVSASAGSASGAQTAPPQSQAADSQPPNSDTAGDESETDEAAAIASKPKSSSSAATNRPANKTAPASKPEAQPAAQPTVAQQSVGPAIVLKSGAIKSSAKAAPPDAAAPPMDALATAGSDRSLSNLTVESDTAKPILQSLTVSQGVSQGLLLKKVQPAYPPTALRMRTEGAVKLLATIGKTGSVSNVKILSGEPLLAHSAVDAVKQWKYKPYLLNGDPVEIQTEVTINFKLPN